MTDLTACITELAAAIEARLKDAEARAWAIHDVGKCDALLYEEDMAAAAADTPDCDCGHPARVLRQVKATRELVAFAFKNAETIDGEWACCHDAAEIASGQCGADGARAALRLLEIIAAQWDT